MSKYIIEIEDTPFTSPGSENELYKATNFRSLVFDEEGLKKLERYEEPSFDSDMSDTYEDGLNDAWIAARRIFCTPMLRPGLLINELFDKKDAISILLDYEAGEVIDRLNKFDQERPQLEAVKGLADKIGINKLYALVKEIRGE